MRWGVGVTSSGDVAWGVWPQVLLVVEGCVAQVEIAVRPPAVVGASVAEILDVRDAPVSIRIRLGVRGLVDVLADVDIESIGNDFLISLGSKSAYQKQGGDGRAG